MNPQRINRWLEQLPPKFRHKIDQEYGTCVGVEQQAVLFEDSTHRIFKAFFERNAQTLIVKACLQQTEQVSLQSVNIGKRHFWALMNSLFAMKPCSSLAQSAAVYEWLKRHSPLQIPVFLGACQLDDQEFMSANFQTFIVGEILQPERVTVDIMHHLANHLVSMHQHYVAGFTHFAELKHVELVQQGEQTNSSVWFSRLSEVLEALPAELFRPYAKPNFTKLLQEMAKQQLKFVPQVIDFRWDQLMRSSQGSLFLLDLDAWVLAPVELDWVMLELVLTPEQLALLVAAYQQYLPVPKIAKQRLVYRALLFAMNLLGETDWQAWCNRPHLLD